MTWCPLYAAYLEDPRFAILAAWEGPRALCIGRLSSMNEKAHPKEIGHSVHGDWQFAFSLVHTVPDGSLTGTARIFRASKVVGMVTSSELSSSTKALLEHLTSRCEQWIASYGASVAAE